MSKRVSLKEETKKKISKSLMGHKFSEETKRKISKTLTGRKLPKRTRDRMRKVRTGEGNANWQGGISFNPYTVDWTESLRVSIRERDRYACQFCGEKQGDRVFDVHHIDYDKSNCSPKNLITLCRKCNARANFNRRDWTDYFNNLFKMKRL